MINQEVIYNLVGQSFFYDPPEGRPTGTPTLIVYRAMSDDEAGGVTATTGACSIDSVNTTLAVAANAGDSTISVGSGTGIARGRRYLLTDVDGDREWIEVISVNGTAVGLRQPLRNAYAVTTSTFVGCRISAAIADAFVQNKSNLTDILDPNNRLWITSQSDMSWIPGAAGYRLRWSYTVASVPTIGVSYADLVRYQAKNLVSPLDVDRRFPNWIDRLPTDYQEDQGVGLIDEAFQAVKMDALGDAQVIRRLRNTEVLRELVIYRANLVALEASAMAGGKGANTETVQLARTLYQQRYDQLFREPKVPVDQTGQGSSAEPRRLAAWQR